MPKTVKNKVSKKYYWAVKQEGEPLFKGSFNACWAWLAAEHGSRPLKFVIKDGIRIGRIN